MSVATCSQGLPHLGQSIWLSWPPPPPLCVPFPPPFPPPTPAMKVYKINYKTKSMLWIRNLRIPIQPSTLVRIWIREPNQCGSGPDPVQTFTSQNVEFVNEYFRLYVGKRSENIPMYRKVRMFFWKPVCQVYLLTWSISLLLDPDLDTQPQQGSGSRTAKTMRIHSDPDKDPQVHNTKLKLTWL